MEAICNIVQYLLEWIGILDKLISLVDLMTPKFQSNKTIHAQHINHPIKHIHY